VDFGIDRDEVGVGRVVDVGLVDVSEGAASSRVPGVYVRVGGEFHEVPGVVVWVPAKACALSAAFARVYAEARMGWDACFCVPFKAIHLRVGGVELDAEGGVVVVVVEVVDGRGGDGFDVRKREIFKGGISEASVFLFTRVGCGGVL
jgi:hypothetical protein